MTPSNLAAPLTETHKTAALFLSTCGPDECLELRILGVTKKGTTFTSTVAGYFTDPVRLFQAAESHTAQSGNAYVTLNPSPRASLSRYGENAVKFLGKVDATTGDKEVTRRTWLLLDFDPKRLSGIASSELEHNAALTLAWEARETLLADGWPEPVFADSGNGAHLLYRIDLPNDTAGTLLVENVLKSALARFGTPEVGVDQVVFNAARITRF